MIKEYSDRYELITGIQGSDINPFHSIQMTPQSAHSQTHSQAEVKCRYLASPLEDVLTKTFGTIFALIMLTDEPFFSIAIPLALSPFVFLTNYEMYSKTASLPKGVDILNLSDIKLSSTPLSNKAFIKCALKDAGMWFTSIEKAIMYGYSVYSAILAKSNPTLRIAGAFFAGIVAHRADLLGEMRIWSLRRQAEGEPGYENTAGRMLDFTDSFLPIPFLPTQIRKYMRLDPFVARFYADYRAILHVLAGQYVLQNLFGFSSSAALFIAWMMPLGGAEYVYVSSYSQKVMAKSLQKSGLDKAQGLTWAVLALYTALLAPFFNLMNGRLSSALWGIIFPPIPVYKLGKILGSGIIGTAASLEISKQVPELVSKFSSNHVEFPDSVKLYILPILFTIILSYIGHVQVKAADSRLMDGEHFGFPESIHEEFGIDPDAEPENPEPISYCSGVSQRGKGVLNQIHEGLKSLLSILPCKKNPAREPLLQDNRGEYDTFGDVELKEIKNEHKATPATAPRQPRDPERVADCQRFTVKLIAQSLACGLSLGGILCLIPFISGTESTEESFADPVNQQASLGAGATGFVFGLFLPLFGNTEKLCGTTHTRSVCCLN